MGFLGGSGQSDLTRPRMSPAAPAGGAMAGGAMGRGRPAAPAPITPSPFSMASPAGMTRPPDANPNASVPPVGPPMGGPAPTPTATPGAGPATWGQAGGGRALTLADQIENDRKTRGPRR